jgi:hypothetical protein
MGTSDSDEKVSDEEILNVLRRTKLPQSTGEVSEQIDLGQKRTGERLNLLEDSGRVQSKTYGQSRAWWLDSSEFGKPVYSDSGFLLRHRHLLYNISRNLLFIATAGFGAGGFGMITSLSSVVFESSLPLMTANELLVVSYATLAISVCIGAVAFVIKSMIFLIDLGISRSMTNK